LQPNQALSTHSQAQQLIPSVQRFSSLQQTAEWLGHIQMLLLSKATNLLQRLAAAAWK
jgi:hypothetical protein